MGDRAQDAAGGLHLPGSTGPRLDPLALVMALVGVGTQQSLLLGSAIPSHSILVWSGFETGSHYVTVAFLKLDV